MSGGNPCAGDDTIAPTPPAAVLAIRVLNNKIELAWDAASDNLGVTGYRVLRNGADVGTTASLGFTDHTVTLGTSYSYTVRAYDAAGNVSSDSLPFDVTTPPTPGLFGRNSSSLTTRQ